MGCFNGTCALTQLPIVCGDNVVVYVLKANPYTADDLGGMICYSDDLYKPFGLPLYGKYNDYGSVEKISNPEIGKLIVSAADFKGGDIYEMLEAIRENHRSDENLAALKRIACRGYAYVLFHKFAVDTVIKSYKGEDKWISSKLKTFKECTECPRMLSFHDFKMDSKFSEILSVDKINDLERHLEFCMMMNHLRKTWIPQAGGGSQWEGYENYKALSNAVIKHCDKMIKKYGNDE